MVSVDIPASLWALLSLAFSYFLSFSHWDSSSAMEDLTNPYFLHQSDSPGVVLVSQPLTGDNYDSWSLSMELAFPVKNNVGLSMDHSFVPMMIILSFLHSVHKAITLFFHGSSILFLKKSLEALCDPRSWLRSGRICVNGTSRRMALGSFSFIVI